MKKKISRDSWCLQRELWPAGAKPSRQMRHEEKARCCGVHKISMSKRTKQHITPRTLLEVELSKKVHAVVGRSTSGSQNVQSTPRSIFGSCGVERVTPVWRKPHFQDAPCLDHFLEADMLKNGTPSWREAHFQVKSEKKNTEPLGRSNAVLRGRHKGFSVPSKMSKT